MPRTLHRPLLALAAAGVLGCSTLAIAAPADAAERGARAKRAAPAGDYTRHTERRRTDTGHTRRDTWSRADGSSATRNAVVVNDREAGVRTRDVEWQGSDGRRATRHDVTTRTDDGYTRNSTITTPKGETITREATVERDREAGTRTREAVTTLPDGRTRTSSDVTTKTDDGYARSTMITNPNGSTLQRDVDANYDPQTRTWQRQVEVDRTPAPELAPSAPSTSNP